MHSLELEWINQIQQIRSPFLDLFFLALRFFDRVEFAFALIPIIWLNYGMKNGIRLFYILFLNTIFNSLLKLFFASPRPCDLNPKLALFFIDHYGFPSGAAQTVILLSGLFITYVKTPWKWAIILPYTLLVSFSRVYLGVHFPTDILGGWFFGFLILLLILYAFPKVEKKIGHLTFHQKIGLHLVFTLTLIGFLPIYSKEAYAACSIGFAVGMELCYVLNLYLALSKKVKDFMIRSIVGVGSVFALYTLVPIPFFLHIFVISLWISLGAPFLLKKSCL